MKKLYLLSGVIVLSVIANINAMKSNRSAVYQMIDASIKNWRDIDWSGVFAILDSMQNVISVNEYRSLQGDSLLYLAAVGTGSYVAAKTLLEKYGANPNIDNDKQMPGVTPLRQLVNNLGVRGANVKSDLPMIQLLLAYGANPNIKDKNGEDCFFEVKKLKNNKLPLASDLLKILEPYRKNK
jgi:hypothetical protein